MCIAPDDPRLKGLVVLVACAGVEPEISFLIADGSYWFHDKNL